MDIDLFYQKAAGFSPNPLQRAAWDAYYNESDGHPALLIKAGTGTGKTEAVLFPAIADRAPKPRRIIIVMPSKALIEDMGERVKALLKRLSEHLDIDANLTVDMGGSCRRFSIDEWKNGGNKNGNEWRRFHRHLFVDDIIITTLDKFLFRLFGYGEKIKSFIFPHRVFGSKLAKRPFIIFDEAHEYDGLAFSNFRKLLEALYIKGKDLCVMSATMPPRFVDFLTPVNALDGEIGARQAAFQKSGKDVVSFDKHLILLTKPEGDATRHENIISAIAKEVRQRRTAEKRIIARTEFVSDLATLYEKLKNLDPIIYHGRMTVTQRTRAIREILERQGRGDGFLVLATSAIEAGCDLDAHLIITELCNPDSLAQLAGRLNRRGKMADALLIVIGDRIKPLVSALDETETTEYLNELAAMGNIFDAGRLQRFFTGATGDWMGEILFDMLWEYVYEGDLTSKPLWDRGILVTRSWEPAITLCTGMDEKTQRPQNPIQIGISRLARNIKKNGDELKKEAIADRMSISPEGVWHADLYRAFFNPGNPEESRWRIRPMTGANVSLYESNLICVIQPDFIENYFDETLGYIFIPKIFLKGYRDGFKQYLDYRPERKKDGCFSVPSGRKYPACSGRVWFLDKMGR